MKTFRITFHVTEDVFADDEEEALGMFWDDLMRSQAEEENATVEEPEDGHEHERGGERR